jgi:hypothetical protein
VRGPSVKLTDSGLRCCNPACAAVLFVELMAAPDAGACFDCDPEQFREGWSPVMVEAFALAGEPLPTTPAAFQELYERSGGRLPPYDALHLRMLGVSPFHCSEACCAARNRPADYDREPFFDDAGSP